MNLDMPYSPSSLLVRKGAGYVDKTLMTAGPAIAGAGAAADGGGPSQIAKAVVPSAVSSVAYQPMNNLIARGVAAASRYGPSFAMRAPRMAMGASPYTAPLLAGRLIRDFRSWYTPEGMSTDRWEPQSLAGQALWQFPVVGDALASGQEYANAFGYDVSSNPNRPSLPAQVFPRAAAATNAGSLVAAKYAPQAVGLATRAAQEINRPTTFLGGIGHALTSPVRMIHGAVAGSPAPAAKPATLTPVPAPATPQPQTPTPATPQAPTPAVAGLGAMPQRVRSIYSYTPTDAELARPNSARERQLLNYTPPGKRTTPTTPYQHIA